MFSSQQVIPEELFSNHICLGGVCHRCCDSVFQIQSAASMPERRNEGAGTAKIDWDNIEQCRAIGFVYEQTQRRTFDVVA